jgi:hypothetical protein
MSFMENPQKRRYFFKLHTDPTEKELAFFEAFVQETLRFKRLHAIDLIDDVEAIAENGNGLFSRWTAIFKKLLEAFPVRTFVRICGRRLATDPSFVERWGSAAWGLHRDRVMILSTFDQAESYLDALLEKEIDERFNGTVSQESHRAKS